MLSGWLASARELRNPLTIGYSVTLTFWLLAGEAVHEATRADPLGRRILAALDSLPDAAKLALLTFIATMLGSILWNSVVSRLVKSLSSRAGHPDWEGLIDEARAAVRHYEEHEVITYKGQSGGTRSPFDAKHRVPSSHHGAYLHERVQERERKASEVSFRVTLAIALVPVALGLGVRGAGLWWLSLLVVPLVWFDVALLKHTTLGEVRRFQLEDVRSRREQAEASLRMATKGGVDSGEEAPSGERARRDHWVSETQAMVDKLKQEERDLRSADAHWRSRFFALIEGPPRR